MFLVVLVPVLVAWLGDNHLDRAADDGKCAISNMLYRYE